MSAYDPKQTSLVAAHMSAFGDKADITRTLQTLCELRHIGWVIFSLSLHH